MIKVITNNSGNCCGPVEKECVFVPHDHDGRYYTKEETDTLLENLEKEIQEDLDDLNSKLEDIIGEIGKLILGQGIPTSTIGNKDDLYIDYEHIRRPIYSKATGSWIKITNLNELDNEILETTQEV